MAKNELVSIFLSTYKAPALTIKDIPDIFPYMRNWYESVKKQPELHATVFLDYIPDGFIEKYATERIKFRKCNPKTLNAIDSRWKVYREFLEVSPEIENVFFTDITDVLVLKNPFPEMQAHVDKVFCGDEAKFDNKPIDISWNWMHNRWELLRKIQPADKHYAIGEFLSKHGKKAVLNAGLLGGNKMLIIDVVRRMEEFLDRFNVHEATVDMNALNYILYSYFEKSLIHGSPVNTEFWTEDWSNKICWFKHK